MGERRSALTAATARPRGGTLPALTFAGMELQTPLIPRGRPRLLVVEDGEEVAFALREYFTEHGFDVSCATTLEEACAMAATLSFSAAIVDCRLSGSGSQEGIAVLRSLSRKRPAPCCVVLTAYASPELEDVARGIGASAVFLKPTPLALIAGAIDSALEQRSGKEST